MQKFILEFILHTQNATLEMIKSSLGEFAEEIEVMDCMDATGEAKNYKINLRAEEPTLVFDLCSQFGRIKSAKVNEEKE